MDYETYQQALAYDARSPARAALEGYWDRLIRIAEAEDQFAALQDEVVCLEANGTLVLATGGPHVELTPTGEIRARWTGQWIYSQPESVEEHHAARTIREIVAMLEQA